MPWIAITASGLLTASIGISPIDFLTALFRSQPANEDVGAAIDPSLQPLVDKIITGIILIGVGALITTAGSVFAFFRPYGGLVMLAGSLIALGGAASVSFSIGVLGTLVSLGPSFGVGVALLGGIIASLGFVVKEAVPIVPSGPGAQPLPTMHPYYGPAPLTPPWPAPPAVGPPAVAEPPVGYSATPPPLMISQTPPVNPPVPTAIARPAGSPQSWILEMEKYIAKLERAVQEQRDFLFELDKALIEGRIDKAIYGELKATRSEQISKLEREIADRRQQVSRTTQGQSAPPTG